MHSSRLAGSVVKPSRDAESASMPPGQTLALVVDGASHPIDVALLGRWGDWHGSGRGSLVHRHPSAIIPAVSVAHTCVGEVRPNMSKILIVGALSSSGGSSKPISLATPQVSEPKSLSGCPVALR